MFNRRRFNEELGRCEVDPDRGHHAAVVVIDLDHLKQVNDTLGHQAGDELIKRVASSLRDRLRAADVLARLGGDEFAAIVPSGSPEQAGRMAEGLVQAVWGNGHHDSVSVGVAMLSPIHRADALAKADAAMYRAKRAGGRRAAVFGMEGSGTT